MQKEIVKPQGHGLGPIVGEELTVMFDISYKKYEILDPILIDNRNHSICAL